MYAPNYSSILDQLSAGNSFYNAFQITESKRLSHGLTVLLNYTWSKFLDNASDDQTVPFNPFNIRANYGLSNNDIPHRLVGSFIWQLTSLAHHNGFLRTVAGGWELNGIVTLQSGSPFSVLSGLDNSQSGVSADHADLIGDWRIATDQSKSAMLNQYFNTAAFVVNTPGTFGNTGRNILSGPALSNVDIGAVKNFRITERYRAQLRAEAFNIANHANFGNPNNSVSSTTFGRITTAADPRVMQVALKMLF